MTVGTSGITSGPYAGNGIATDFSYTFRIDDNTQVQVYEKVGVAAPVLLTIGIDYTVAGVGADAGGLITRVAGALPTGSTWYIRSNYNSLQANSFGSQGAFLPQVHEAAMDKLTFGQQQLVDKVARSIQMAASESSGVSMELPQASDRALKALVFNADGSVGVSVYDYDIQAAAVAVLAAAAAASETAAAASEVASDASAAAALVSENNAAASLASIAFRTINKQAGNYIVLTTDRNKLIEYTGTGGHIFTLPTTATLGDGFEFHIKNAGTGSMDVDANTIGGAVIDGVNSITLVPGQSVVIVCDDVAGHYEVTQSRGYALLASASTVSNTPAGNIAATDVQGALNELDTEKASKQYVDARANYANDSINGQFRVAQAGTSFPAPVTNTYDLDGWLFRYIGTGVVTVAQATGSTTGKLARAVTVTTADAAIAAGNYYASVTKIEGHDAVKYLAEASTVGVTVSAPVIGIHCIAIYNGTSTYVQEVDILVANTPQAVVLNFPLTPVIASAVNAWGLEIRFTNACGATYQTTADAWNAGDFYATANQVNDMATISNVFTLEDVTFNLGTSVVPDTATYEQDLARCQRYYKEFTQIKLRNGAALSENVIFERSLPVEMRVAPTVTFTTALGSGVSAVPFVDGIQFVAVSDGGQGRVLLSNITVSARL